MMFAIGFILFVASVLSGLVFRVEERGPAWFQAVTATAAGIGLGLMLGSVAVFLWKNMP